LEAHKRIVGDEGEKKVERESESARLWREVLIARSLSRKLQIRNVGNQKEGL
jgi:hypothetical protein